MADWLVDPDFTLRHQLCQRNGGQWCNRTVLPGNCVGGHGDTGPGLADRGVRENLAFEGHKQLGPVYKGSVLATPSEFGFRPLKRTSLHAWPLCARGRPK